MPSAQQELMMLHKSFRLFPIVIVALAIGWPAFNVAKSQDKPLSVKRGKIDMSEERRSFAKDVLMLAKKYPSVVAQSRIFENMCEAGSGCFYVQSWTACCCPTAGDTVCEVWPPQ
jgi:hypothetical protein